MVNESILLWEKIIKSQTWFCHVLSNISCSMTIYVYIMKYSVVFFLSKIRLILLWKHPMIHCPPNYITTLAWQQWQPNISKAAQDIRIWLYGHLRFAHMLQDWFTETDMLHLWCSWSSVLPDQISVQHCHFSQIHCSHLLADPLVCVVCGLWYRPYQGLYLPLMCCCDVIWDN